MGKQLRRVGSVLLCLGLLAAGCGGSADDPDPGPNAQDTPDQTEGGTEDDTSGAEPCESFDEVTVRFSYLVFATHTPYVVADEQGYYEQACIRPTMELGQGSSFAVQIVGSGEEEFGHAAGPSVMAGAAQEVPSVSVAEFYDTSLMALFARADTGIEEPCDIEGHTLGVFVGSVTELLTRALLEQCGLTEDDVEMVTVSPGGDLPLVLNGDIDAEVTYWANELTEWEITQPDLDIRIWRAPELGFDLPGESLIANQSMLDENPDLVRRFVAATMQGAEYARDNVEEAAQTLVDRYGDLELEVELAKWQAMSGILSEPLGSHDPAQWESMEELMVQYGMLDEPVLDSANVFTDSFLP